MCDQGLENKRYLCVSKRSGVCSAGKFVLYVQESQDLDTQLACKVELVHGIEPSDDLRSQIANVILRELLRVNSEYANYVTPERQLPLVTLFRYGDPDHFPVGVKHKYTL